MTTAIIPHILTAWHQVGLDYNAGLINSEGCMQAAFYSALRHQLPEGYRIFVEPTWRTPPDKSDTNSDISSAQLPAKTFPDLVICRNTSIVAVMELKFVPQHYPKFEQDIQKLIGFGCDQNYNVSIEPETGKWPTSDEPPYNLAPFALRVFAVIGSIESKGVYLSDIAEKYKLQNFLLLYGRVNGGIAFFGSDM